MECKIGIAVNVDARVRMLKNNGEVPASATYRTMATGLIRTVAIRRAAYALKYCGSPCEGLPDGEGSTGDSWSVYRVNW